MCLRVRVMGGFGGCWCWLEDLGHAQVWLVLSLALAVCSCRRGALAKAFGRHWEPGCVFLQH